MAKRFDLTGENVTRRESQRNTYGNQTPLSSTAVERGETHWMDGSYVRIDGLLDVNGTATVGGTLSVTGTLNASGSINLSGSTGITGPLNVTGTTTIGGNTSITGELVVTGPTTLDGITDIGGDTTITGKLDVTGDTTISGLLDITGDTTVDGNFEILGGGLFKAGETTIEPTGKATFGDVVIDPSSPRMIESPAGWLTANGPDSIGLSSSLTSSVNLNSTAAELNFGGSTVVRVAAREGGIDLSAPKTWVTGQLEVASIARFQTSLFYFSTTLPTHSNPPNLYIHTDGRAYRSTWTP